MLDDVPGEEVEVGATEDRPTRIERMVEQHDPGFRRKGRLELPLVEAPMGRLQGDEAWDTTGAADQRQIGVIHRLEQHDLITRLITALAARP